MEEIQRINKNILTFPVAAPFDVVYRNCATDYPVGPHSHNAVELYFALTDLPDVLLNDTVSAVPAGTLIVIPTFCVHQLYHESGKVYERYILSINTQWLDHAFCGRDESFLYLKESGTPLFLTPDPEQRKKWIHAMEALITAEQTLTPEAMSCLFETLALLKEMVTLHSASEMQMVPISTSQKTVNEMISYIQEHIYENLSVNSLAEHFYLHPDYLSRLFKKHAHTSIGHYILLQKIATAQSLLREGYTVAQVQEKLAYSSYAYFFKIFQKNSGMSPSQYREQFSSQKAQEKFPVL